MKRPFDTVKEIFADNLERSREDTKFMFEQADKFMVWIVGFSIGGLSLIVSNIINLDKKFNYYSIKSILILLAISIITGIIYRIAFSIFQAKFRETEFYIEGAFSNKEIMNINPDDLSQEVDIKQIIKKINDDYGEDLSYILPIYENANQQYKDFIIEDLKRYYKKTGEWVKEDWNFSINYAKEVYKKAFGFSDSKIDKVFNEDASKLLKFWRRIVAVSFYTSCISFFIVIILLCATY